MDAGIEQIESVLEGAKAVIFDLGNVLVHIESQPALVAMAEIAGVSRAELERRFAAIGREFETGAIDTPTAVDRLLSGGRTARARRLVEATFAARFTPIASTIEFAHTLAERGVFTALASNTNPLDYGEVRSRYPDVLAPFAGRIFLSYEMGVMKPACEFYRHIHVSLGLEAADCLFVDDLEENVAGARTAGMRAVRFLRSGAGFDG